MTRPGAETIEIEPVHLFNLKDYRPLFTARLQAFFGDSVPGGGHLLFGARCGGEPAGAVWGGPDRNPGGLFLFHLYVPERFRRRGVGRRLLETVCAAASEA
ncbi:GNAT family N-acetyltransferase, partial [Victivallis vadensis]